MLLLALIAGRLVATPVSPVYAHMVLYELVIELVALWGCVLIGFAKNTH